MVIIIIMILNLRIVWPNANAVIFRKVAKLNISKSNIGFL